MSNEKKEKKKEPWTARRIIALIGIILLAGLYASTLIFALMDSPAARGLLMGAVFCTIAVPVLLYAMTLVAKTLRGKGVPPQELSAPEEPQESSDPETVSPGQHS